MKTETVSGRGVKPAPSAKQTQSSDLQMPLSFDLAALTLGGIMDEEAMDRIITESAERGEIPAKLLCRIIKTWIEGGGEGDVEKAPEEFERFASVFEKEIASAFDKRPGYRQKIMQRGAHYYLVAESVSVKCDGDFRAAEEVAERHGAEHLAKLLRVLPATDIERHGIFEPISREGVLDWMREHLLPSAIPAEFIGDFKPKEPRPWPLITPTKLDADNRSTLAGVTFGMIFRKWDTSELACTVAFTLNQFAEFIRKTVFSNIQKGDADRICAAAEFAEILTISREVDDALADRFTWSGARVFELPGIGMGQPMSAPEFLESAAFASQWAWEALADAAPAQLSPSDCLSLLDVLMILEVIADEWGGLETDRKPGEPSQLALAASKARLAFSMQAAP